MYMANTGGCHQQACKTASQALPEAPAVMWLCMTYVDPMYGKKGVQFVLALWGSQ